MNHQVIVYDDKEKKIKPGSIIRIRDIDGNCINGTLHTGLCIGELNPVTLRLNHDDIALVISTTLIDHGRGTMKKEAFVLNHKGLGWVIAEYLESL